MPCIYAIKHKETGFVYVGFTIRNVKVRFSGHIALLKKGGHSAVGLQEDWDRCGKHAFELVILETLPDDVSVVVKRTAELRWMQHFDDKLYNHSQVSFGVRQDGKGCRTGSKSTPEANEKRRLAQLGKPKGHGDKISATKLRLNQRPTIEAAKMGGIAACKLRWGNIDS